MSESDKTANARDKIAGKTKEAAGKVTNNEEQEREGRREQRKADVRQAGEKVKDALND
jgi:uncharacterized protein YjbJ (UPF0337 family)